MTTAANTLLVRDLGLQHYQPIWQAMQKFTAQRDESTPDELWCLEHPAVFTLGLNGKKEHLLTPSTIPVISVDRGGQVTYHGPGQLVIYTLLDLARLNIGVKDLVSSIEKSVIQLLSDYEIQANGKENAPGVYIGDAKIAALGLRIKKNKSYHGLSLNLDMDLSPFRQINPCGYAGMPVTQITDLKPGRDLSTVKTDLVVLLTRQLGYNGFSVTSAEPGL